MSIHKDNATGKWRVVYRYTDWTGETHQSSKRGFPTKREAQMWERELLLKKEAKLDMTFESFYEIYVEDMQNRIRDNTWGTKTNIARTKILPYFGKRKIGEIEPRDIIAWQNELLAIRQPNGKPYSASYLQKIHSQLSAIFNHAVNFYHLPSEHRFAAGIPVFRGLWISSRTMSMRLLGAQCGGRVLLGCLTRGNQAADQREHHA